MISEQFARTVACLGLTAAFACGGGNESTPTSPGTSPVPTVSACNVIAGTSSSSLAILNGTTCSSSNSSVVLVNLRDRNDLPTGACSGTVIAPRAILTAAHCLVGETAAVRVFAGTGDQLAAQSFHAHPTYRESDPTSFDVGVVLTAENINRTSLPLLVSRDARVGEQAVIAGWGKDENGNGTILRAGTTTISGVNGPTLQTQFSPTTSSVCSGDSGGPLLLSEGGVWALVGVTSSVTVSGACTAGTNFYANVRNSNITSFILGLVPDAARQ